MCTCDLFVRYFLNYALLGWLFNKVNSHAAAVRLAALLEAQSSYLKYLVLTKNYELHKFNIEKMSKTELENDQAKLEKVVLEVDRQASFDANLTSMAHDRNEKIKRFKEQKEFEKQMETLAHVLDSAKRERIDDETRRQFFMTAIKYWINQAVDDLKCVNGKNLKLLKLEMEILFIQIIIIYLFRWNQHFEGNWTGEEQQPWANKPNACKYS